MDADTLRLVLILSGGLFLVGLYIWERRRTRPDLDEPFEDDDSDELKREPSLGSFRADGQAGGSMDQDGAAGQSDQANRTGQHELTPGQEEAASEDVAAQGPRSPLILMFHIAPKDGTFDGETIVHAAGECGMEPGEMEIYHRYRDPGTPTVALFSLANMVKPGTFPFGAMADFDSPGLTLFSQAEGASNDLPRLEDMLAAAHCLADRLDGDILDETRHPLTAKTEDQLRDRVLELVSWRLSDTGRE